MTRSEWNQLNTIACGLHGTKLPDLAAQALTHPVVADVPFADASRVVYAHAADGHDFPLKPGQIAAATRPRLPWTEAMMLIHRCGLRFGWDRLDDAQAWLDHESPQLGAWARQYGLRRLMEAKIDAEYERERTEVRAELESSFAAHLQHNPHVRALPARAAADPRALQAG